MPDNKKPYFKPNNFTGSISENIDTFLKKYDRAAIINGWTEAEKTQYIPVFLEGSALTFYDNIIDSGEDLKWADLEKKFRLEFEPIAQTDMLRLMLEKRKQLPDEHTVSYINDAESLCRRIDKDMSQGEMVRSIMKGLKPKILRCIGILGNETLDEFKKNVRKYELIEFMTADSIDKNPYEIETEIIENKIQQINTNNKISKLREEVENLKETMDQLKLSQINNDNKYQNNFTKYDPTFRYNENNSTNYNKNNNNNSAHTIQCSICSKNNHTEYECYFKNKPNIICQLCNKFGHSAITCRSSSTNNKSKKLNIRLNSSDNFSFLNTEIRKQNINKINSTPDSLYIEAQFNSITLPITIYMRANICCISTQ